MTSDEARKLANDIRDFADFVEAKAAEMPYTSFDVSARCYITQTDYVEKPKANPDDPTEWDTVVNEEETKERLAQFLNAVGSCEKEYNGDSLRITKKFGQAKVLGIVNREITCKRKVVGTKIEPAVSYPEREVEVYEWECDDSPSLLAIVKGT